MFREKLQRNLSDKMKETLIFNYRFLVLVTGIFGVFLVLLFGTAHAIPKLALESETESQPTSEFLSATTISSATTSSSSTTPASTITTENPNINETVTSVTTTINTTENATISKGTAVLERAGKVARLGGGAVRFSSEALTSSTSAMPHFSSELSTSMSSLNFSTPPEIAARSSLGETEKPPLDPVVGDAKPLSNKIENVDESGGRFTLPQSNLKEITSKSVGADSTKLTKLIVKSTPTPISVQDKRVRMLWGGDCTLAIWNICSCIKSWGGDYLVQDKINPDKMIKRYYKVNCVEKPEQTFCLRNGWTVARCHMLCMSQCNVDFKLNFDKVVSHDGECQMPILGKK